MDKLEDLALVLKALSDPLRLRLLELLAKRNRSKELCVGDLAEELGISQPNVSHHLKILKSAGLIKSDKCDGCSFYAINHAKLNEIFLLMKDLIQ